MPHNSQNGYKIGGEDVAKEEIKVIPVIKAVCQIGDGSTERPYRTGIEYRDLDGKVLFITEAERSENGEFISVEFRGQREKQALPQCSE